ncbi:MAG: polysaccharide biosynthesis C-terminal domain-containing protein [Flavobacteriales bacterium]|nr:polysaccharide biosynthesis C-terminal domain-containing protein [Flavobacteriales bacterium]
MVLSEVYFILLRSYSRSLRRTVQPGFIREFVLRILQTGLILFQAWKPMPFTWFMALYTCLFLSCTVALAADLFRAGYFKLGWAERWLPSRLRRSMITYSGFTLSASIAGIVLGNMDQLMIGALLSDGLRYVAHYAVGFYFGSVIAAPGRALGQVAVPLLADAWKRNDKRMIADLYRRSALVQTVISGFLFLLLWACVDDLFLLLPAEYAAASEVAVLIGLAYLLTSAIGLSAGIISMSRAYHLDAWSSLAMLLVNVVANFFLIRNFGISGAAWATLMALTVVNAYRTHFLRKKFGLWPFGMGTTKVAALLIAIGCLMSLVPAMGGIWMDMILRAVLISVIFWPGVYFRGLVPDLVAMVKNNRSGATSVSEKEVP